MTKAYFAYTLMQEAMGAEEKFCEEKQNFRFGKG